MNHYKQNMWMVKQETNQYPEANAGKLQIQKIDLSIRSILSSKKQLIYIHIRMDASVNDTIY